MRSHAAVQAGSVFPKNSALEAMTLPGGGGIGPSLKFVTPRHPPRLEGDVLEDGVDVAPGAPVDRVAVEGGVRSGLAELAWSPEFQRQVPAAAIVLSVGYSSMINRIARPRFVTAFGGESFRAKPLFRFEQPSECNGVVEGVGIRSVCALPKLVKLAPPGVRDVADRLVSHRSSLRPALVSGGAMVGFRPRLKHVGDPLVSSRCEE